MGINQIIGKTIKSIKQKQLKDYDDLGYLEIEFTDGIKIIIESFYCGYTGCSKDEYPTDICIQSIEEFVENNIYLDEDEKIKIYEDILIDLE